MRSRPRWPLRSHPPRAPARRRVAQTPGPQLQQHAQDRHGRSVHGRRRLPRQRAAQLGEVRGQDARARSTDSRSASSRVTPPSSRVRQSGPDAGAEVRRGQERRRRDRPVDVRRRRGVEPDVLRGGLAHISRVRDADVADEGRAEEATPSFFRVVPGDYIQGPTDANFMISKGAKNVVLFDFQEPYSQGLADAAELVLKAKGVTTTRQSVSNTSTDFSSFVTKVPSSADFVFFPTQKPGDAQNFAQQLHRAGQEGEGVRRRRLERRLAVQGAGLVRLQLRAGHQRHRRRQGDHRRLEEGQSRRRSSARSARRPTSPRRSRCRRSSTRATPARARSTIGATLSATSSGSSDPELDPRWRASASRRSRTTR